MITISFTEENYYYVYELHDQGERLSEVIREDVNGDFVANVMKCGELVNAYQAEEVTQ